MESAKYRSASLCLGDLIVQGVELNVSPLVIDEVWWGLFKVSYRLLTGNELAGREYKHQIEIWRSSWPRIRQITDEILGWGRLTLLEFPSAVQLVRGARDLIDGNPLGPRDAFHLALALRHRVSGFVTADSDFDAVQLPEGRRLTVVKL